MSRSLWPFVTCLQGLLQLVQRSRSASLHLTVLCRVISAAQINYSTRQQNVTPTSCLNPLHTHVHFPFLLRPSLFFSLNGSLQISFRWVLYSHPGLFWPTAACKVLHQSLDVGERKISVTRKQRSRFKAVPLLLLFCLRPPGGSVAFRHERSGRGPVALTDRQVFSEICETGLFREPSPLPRPTPPQRWSVLLRCKLPTPCPCCNDAAAALWG